MGSKDDGMAEMKGIQMAKDVELKEVQAQALRRQAEAKERDVAEKVSMGRARRAYMVHDASMKTIGVGMRAAENAGTLFHRTIWAFLSKLVSGLYTKLTPYLALIFVFMLVFGGAAAFRAGSTRINGAARKKKYDDQRPWYMRWLDKVTAPLMKITPGYKARRAFAVFNFYGGQPPMVRRPKIGSGRCDNVQWREVGADGRDGLCARTMGPEDIQWDFDTERMDEYTRLPGDLARKISRGGEQLQVSIPYKMQGTFFVPQCKQARFRDGSSAAHLLDDLGLSCARVERQSAKFYPKYRPPKAAAEYKGLDAYATATSPMCAPNTKPPAP